MLVPLSASFFTSAATYSMFVSVHLRALACAAATPRRSAAVVSFLCRSSRWTSAIAAIFFSSLARSAASRAAAGIRASASAPASSPDVVLADLTSASLSLLSYSSCCCTICSCALTCSSWLVCALTTGLRADATSSCILVSNPNIFIYSI